MVARYVIPEINGHIAKLRESQKFLIENRAVFERAGQAVMAKIMENEKAAAALPSPAPDASRSRPSTRRTCRRKPPSARRDPVRPTSEGG